MSLQAKEILEAQAERFEDAYNDIKATLKCLKTETDPLAQDACVMQQLEKNSRL